MFLYGRLYIHSSYVHVHTDMAVLLRDSLYGYAFVINVSYLAQTEQCSPFSDFFSFGEEVSLTLSIFLGHFVMNSLKSLFLFHSKSR